MKMTELKGKFAQMMKQKIDARTCWLLITMFMFITVSAKNKPAKTVQKITVGDIQVEISKDIKGIKLVQPKTGKSYIIGFILNNETSISLQNTTQQNNGLIGELKFGKSMAQFKLTPAGENVELTIENKDKTAQIGLSIQVDKSDAWFGGDVTTAHNWPFNDSVFVMNPFHSTSNQTSPIWYSKNGLGLFVDTYNVMGYTFNSPLNGFFNLWIKDTSVLKTTISFKENIRESFLSLNKVVGIPEKVPPFDYFKYPIFNSWIEFMVDVNQQKIEQYATDITKNGFPYSIIEIDDKWTKKYGDFSFDEKKFPNPAMLFDSLKQKGKDIVLWVTPFIEEASENYQFAKQNNYLIKKADSEDIYFIKWWNGMAAMVDLSNPNAYNWYVNQLKSFAAKYSISGYKLDAGDAEFLEKPYRTFKPMTAQEYTDAFAAIGAQFKINELRVSWRTQKNGLVQRLRDKAPTWSKADGIGSLIPHALTNGMLGYAFVCPDMIGGGLDSGFKNDFSGMDQQMFVRWAQTSALMPMMQFSYAPWKMDESNMNIVRKYVALHESLSNYIYEQAELITKGGLPIIRPLFFEYPTDENVFRIKDQFLLGDKYLVAPVVTKSNIRSIYLPEGNWCDYWTGKLYNGNKTIEYNAAIDILPLFVKVK